jgi:hypothetical protein
MSFGQMSFGKVSFGKMSGYQHFVHVSLTLSDRSNQEILSCYNKKDLDLVFRKSGQNGHSLEWSKSFRSDQCDHLIVYMEITNNNVIVQINIQHAFKRFILSVPNSHSIYI